MAHLYCAIHGLATALLPQVGQDNDMGAKERSYRKIVIVPFYFLRDTL